jgi:phage FluMu protein Com
MKLNGKLMKCDRCGKLLFLQENGEGDLDGGYTRWNKFVNSPKGWESYEFFNDKKYKLLCPKCNELYKEKMSELEDAFMSIAPENENTEIEIVKK